MKRNLILFFAATLLLLSAPTQRMVADDYVCHFYIPAAHGFASETGCAVQWHIYGVEENHLVPLTAEEEASNWYSASFPKEEELYYQNYQPTMVTLLNASTAEAATQTLPVTYGLEPYSTDYYFLVSKNTEGSFLLWAVSEYSSQYPYDYLPYNLQTSENEDTLFVSWESHDTPNGWQVYVYDTNNKVIGNSWVNQGKSSYVLLGNDKPMEITWSVRPSVYYDVQEALAAYSAPFIKSASPKTARNLKAVANEDGTYTFSWDAAASPAVKKYRLYVLDPQNANVLSTDYLQTTTYTGSLNALFSGRYSFHVQSLDENGWNTLGEAVDSFDIAPVAAHDIKVRILINPMSGVDTSEGVKFVVEKSATTDREEVDATAEPYGWYSYTCNTTERGIRVGVKSGYWPSTQAVYGDTCMEYTGNYQAADCDARAMDYQPHDVLASANEDGTYTISWLMDRTDRVSYYRVNIYNSSTGEHVFSADDLKSAQVNIGVLANAGIYNVQIDVYEEIQIEYYTNHNRIGSYYNYFEVAAVATHDITVRVLPQPGTETWGAFIYNEADYDYTTAVPFAKDGETPWYTYTFNTTDPAVSIRFLKASDYWNGTMIACADNTCIELDSEFKKVDCSTKLQDFTITNLQRTGEDYQMEFSWECASDPERFVVLIDDAEGNNIRTLSTGGSNRSLTTTLIVDSTMPTVKWSVYPAKKYGMGEYRVEGTPFSLTASPYVPQNLAATPNNDGTWTITWDALPEPITSYKVELSNGYTEWVFEPRYVTPIQTNIGVVTATVTAQIRNYLSVGSKSIQFEVKEVAARDITLRLLLNPDAERSIGDIEYKSSPSMWSYQSATDEGNGWYSYTMTSTMPVVEFSLMGYRDYIAKDTCYEYSSYLTRAACDAEPHDYRITNGSLQAVSLPGKAVFSWSAKEKSTRYTIALERYYEEYSYWTSVVYENVEDTCYTYLVPDDYDGMEVRWYVYPSEPHNLYSQRMVATDLVTLQKSKIEISGMQVTTTDSVTYHFSWDCNTDTVFYEALISQGYYSSPFKRVVQATRTMDHTFLSGASGYSWRVRAVNAAGEPLTQWFEDKASFYVRSSLRAVTNLKGSVSGRTLTYTWEKTTPYVMVSLGGITADGDNILLAYDSIISGNTFVATATKDAMYQFVMEPALNKVDEGYLRLDENHRVTLSVFTEQTYKVDIRATKGGVISDELSGMYPKGFNITMRCWAEEGYQFVGWSDGWTDSWRTLEVQGDTTLIALFEPKSEYHIHLTATQGGLLFIYNREVGVSQLDTTMFRWDYLNFEVKADAGYVFCGWSDGYDETQLNRGLDINGDTTIQAIFKPLRYVTVAAATGGRVQVQGGEYDKTRKAYTCVEGKELLIKATADDGYRFTQWSDGDVNVTRTLTVTSDLNLTAMFETIATPLDKYILRVLTSDAELGQVSQVSGTYNAGDKVTISAEATVRAKFVKWSDDNTETTRIITISSDSTLTAIFAVRYFTLTIAAGEGGSVNTTVNGTYEYGESVDLTATPEEHYQFIGWSDGYPYANRTVKMTEDYTLTALFTKEQYLVTFLNADGSLIEANRYSYGETPVCSVTPELEATAEWTYTFMGWTPAISAVTGNAVYTAVYEKTANHGSDIEETVVCEKAVKVLVDGQIYIIRGGKTYTIQGQLLR